MSPWPALRIIWLFFVIPLEKRLTLNEYAYVYFTHHFLGLTHAVFNDGGHTHFSSVVCLREFGARLDALQVVEGLSAQLCSADVQIDSIRNTGTKGELQLPLLSFCLTLHCKHLEASVIVVTERGCHAEAGQQLQDKLRLSGCPNWFLL